MHRVKSLPDYLLTRYQHWKETSFPESRAWFQKLAAEGQSPRAMVIACCDSRVEVNAVFGHRTGELFIHRNIANLVPPYQPDGSHHGTSAAIEYAVKHLKVSHILVQGHSQCGGVAGCISMCKGEAPEFDRPESFLGRWLEILAPAFETVQGIQDLGHQQTALEKEGIHTSLQNLLGYPFVKEAVDAGTLTLHGVWADIGEMDIETFDGTVRHFSPA